MVRNKNSSANVSTIQPYTATASITKPGPSNSNHLTEESLGEIQKSPKKVVSSYATSLSSSSVALSQNKVLARRRSGSLSPSKPRTSYLGMNGVSKSAGSGQLGKSIIKLNNGISTSVKLGASSCCNSNLNGLFGTHLKDSVLQKTGEQLNSEEWKLSRKERNNMPHDKTNNVTKEMDVRISRMTAQTNVYRKMFGVFKIGEEVLARWSDGLYYLGGICDVDEYKHQCEMKFEDESRFWVRFKDLHRMTNTADESDDDGRDSKKQSGSGEMKEQEEEMDLNCVLCRDGVSDPPNEIVLCDKCGQGYHQQCHLPHIDTSVLTDEEVPWQCRNCVFSACVRSGGAISTGTGEIMKQMKCVHPYDINSLSWNKNHKTNAEEIYCYCGGPGDWYLKMLQCLRCNQWFHEACLQCLESPILYGDRFFLFICSVCNNGNEYIKHLPMKWVDVVNLVLYNITIAKKVKYYDVDVISSFFNKHMESLRLGDLAKDVATRSHLKQKIIDVLQSNKTRFQCGSECKKAKVIWGLRNRSPPLPPSISLPTGIEINDETLSSLDLRHGTASLSDSPTPLKKQGPCQSSGTNSPQNVLNEKKNVRSPVKDLVKSGLFNMSSINDASQDNLFERFRADVFNHQSPLISISDCNMPPPKKRRGRPKKRSFEGYPPPGSLKRTSSSSSLNSSKLSWTGPPSKKRKRKLSDVSRDSTGSGRASETGSSVSRLWGNHISALDEGSSCSSGSAERRAGDPDMLRDAIARYFGAEGRVQCGERFRVCGKRVRLNEDGTERHEYLIEWEGYTARDLESLRKV